MDDFKNFNINEKKKKEIKDPVAKRVNATLMKKLGWIGVGVIATIYLFWGFFKPALTNASIIETILAAGASIVIAISISNLMSAQGIMDGSIDTDVVNMKHEHIKVVDEANNYVEWSDEWSDEENMVALRTARRHILMSAGLKYSSFFNEDGDYLDTDIPEPSKDAHKYVLKRYNDKMSAVQKALTYSITPVSMSRLSAESSVDLDPNKLDKEPTEYQKAKALRSLWMKVLSVIVFSKITWVLIDGADFLQSLFNGAIQIVVFLLLGIISYYSSYTYMLNTYVGNLRKKINLLKRLIAFGKKQDKKLLEVTPDGTERRIDSIQETRRDSTISETISGASEKLQPATSAFGVPSQLKPADGTAETAKTEHESEQKPTVGTGIFGK